MNTLDKVNISQFIWYLVPGLALTLFVLLPVLFLLPELLKLYFTQLGTIGLLLISVIGGFIVDGLRLYRFRPFYNKTKTSFFKKLQSEIGSDLNPYTILSAIQDVATESKFSGFNLRHAIWIMLGHLTVLSVIEGLFWVGYVVWILCHEEKCIKVINLTMSYNKALVLYICMAVVFLAIGLRFGYVCMKDQETSNEMYLNFAIKQKNRIKKLIGN